MPIVIWTQEVNNKSVLRNCERKCPASDNLNKQRPDGKDKTTIITAINYMTDTKIIIDYFNNKELFLKIVAKDMRLA